MFCMECGKELPQNAKFCPYCGTKATLTGAVEAKVSAPAPGGRIPGSRDVICQLGSEIEVVGINSVYYDVPDWQDRARALCGEKNACRMDDRKSLRVSGWKSGSDRGGSFDLANLGVNPEHLFSERTMDSYGVALPESGMRIGWVNGHFDAYLDWPGRHYDAWHLYRMDADGSAVYLGVAKTNAMETSVWRDGFVYFESNYKNDVGKNVIYRTNVFTAKTERYSGSNPDLLQKLLRRR